VDSSSTPEGGGEEGRGGRGRGGEGGGEESEEVILLYLERNKREQLFSRKGGKLGFGKLQICLTFFSNSSLFVSGSESPGRSYCKPASKGMRNSYQHTIGC